MDVRRQFRDNNPEPSHVYLNINISNFGDATDPIARFQEARTSAIVDNPSNYELSVVRFAISSMEIPIMIVPVQLGQPDPNKTIFQVRLTNAANGQTAERSVMWSPQTDAAVPVAPLVSQDVSTSYYYLRDYEHLMNLVNDALALANVDLGVETPAPFFQYDARSHTFSLYTPLAYDVRQGASMRVGVNEYLYNLFPNIPSLRAGHVFTYRPFLNLMKSNVATLGEQEYVVMTQEFPNLQNWNVLNTIVITTSSIPVLNEGLAPSPVKLFGQASQNTGNAGNKQLNILTDFGVQSDVGYEARQGYVYYNPTAEYRLTDLQGHSPLTNIDIQVFWQDKWGTFYPLVLSQGAMCNLKIMFRRKEA